MEVQTWITGGQCSQYSSSPYCLFLSLLLNILSIMSIHHACKVSTPEQQLCRRPNLQQLPRLKHDRLQERRKRVQNTHN